MGCLIGIEKAKRIVLNEENIGKALGLKCCGERLYDDDWYSKVGVTKEEVINMFMGK